MSIVVIISWRGEMNMKKLITICSFAAMLSVALPSCIEETFPQSSTATSEQIGASASAMEASLNGIPAEMARGYLVYGSQTLNLIAFLYLFPHSIPISTSRFYLLQFITV